MYKVNRVLNILLLIILFTGLISLSTNPFCIYILAICGSVCITDEIVKMNNKIVK